VRVRAGGTSLVRLDRGGPGAPDAAGAADRLHEVLATAGAVLVSDYGGGTTSLPQVREALVRRPPGVPLVWDPHPRGAEPVPGATLVTPNADEARRLHGEPADLPTAALAATEARAAALVARWGASAVAVTLGARGALLSWGDGTPVVAPAPFTAQGDACGAGDRFASAAAQALGAGGGLSDALTHAVATAAAFVAAGGAASVEASPAPGPAAAASTGGRREGPADPQAPPASQAPEGPEAPEDVVRRLRAAVGATGSVVATGGCFDLLHAGHVATLRAARALGDALVVCLNSDASVSRLKGPTRPLVTAEDRARVLEALECVDAVVVFDEDTPEAVLARLRPDVWAKGGDYADVALPESDLVRSWGGQPVVLPYLDGRSTTGLVTRITAGGTSR
jgi:rfaE bifunctional protein nucleotidyltransferase chain/domain